VQPTSNPVDQHLMELMIRIDAFRRSTGVAHHDDQCSRFNRMRCNPSIGTDGLIVRVAD
jgi:hypothetical protein